MALPTPSTAPRTTARNGVFVYGPRRAGNGTTTQWTRTIAGTLYGFAVVNMPDGEVRWAVSRFNGYVGGPKWGCAWDVIRTRTFAPGVLSSASV